MKLTKVCTITQTKEIKKIVKSLSLDIQIKVKRYGRSGNIQEVIIDLNSRNLPELLAEYKILKNALAHIKNPFKNDASDLPYNY